MSTVIIFPGNDDWFKANWIVRELFDDVRERFELSEEEDFKLEQGLALNGLSLPRIEANTRKRIMHMLKTTAMELVNDNSGVYRGDLPDEQYQLYKRSLPSLIELIEKYENVDWPPPKERKI